MMSTLLDEKRITLSLDKLLQLAEILKVDEKEFLDFSKLTVSV